MNQEHSRPYLIGVIPGDGIGPEVVNEALKVLERAAAIHGFRYETVKYPWSSRLYRDTGQLMTAAALDDYRRLDALFLGALGDPRVERGLVERSVIMTLRLGLDLYVNVRPIVLYAEHLCPLKRIRPQDVDLVIVRENTEDSYVGVGGTFKLGTPHEVAIAEMIYTRSGVERAIRYAFELARIRNKRQRVTLVDKSNAIRPQEIWRRVLDEVAAEFPDIRSDAIYVDAAAMYLIDEPDRFDVIVTTNLFGDILTDLGASIQGGLGGAASGNIHPGRLSMFEPVHGSAPDIAGKKVASPVGAILAMSMLLEYIGEKRAGRLVEAAVAHVLTERRLPSLDVRSGISTDVAGDMVVEAMTRLADR